MSPREEDHIVALAGFIPHELRELTASALRAVLIVSRSKDMRPLAELIDRTRPDNIRPPEPPSAAELEKMRSVAAAHPWLGRGSELKAVDFIRTYFAPWLERGLDIGVLRNLTPSYKTLAHTYQVNKARGEIPGLYIPPRGRMPSSTVPVSQKLRHSLTEEEAEARRVRRRKNEAKYEAKRRAVRSRPPH